MTHAGDDIQLRGGPAALWAEKNPVLMERETGWETDTRRVKLGDGVTAWNDLPYAADEAADVAVETAARIAADTNLQNQITALDGDVVKDGDGAGGVLSGSFPNPGFAVNMAEQSELDNAIAAEVTARNTAIATQHTADVAQFVDVAGDTMSGALAINKTAALMIDLLRSDNGVNSKRWKVNIQTNGDVTFDLYNDADVFVATLLRIQRSGLGGSIGGSQFINFTGSPEGVFTATTGTRYIDTNATGGNVEWVKTTASGNTGWVSQAAALAAEAAARNAADWWKPADNGFLAVNFPPQQVTSQVLLPGAGVYVLQRVYIPAGVAITNLHCSVWVAGSGLTYAAAAVYEANGTRSGLTGSQITPWQSTGFKTMPLGAPIAAQGVDRFVYVALMSEGSTQPQLNIESVYVTANLGLAAPNLAACYIFDASPLASNISLAGQEGYYSYWVGVT